MSKVIIIAEAGVNHNGDMENAKRLIDCASKCGVDYVKFQTFKTQDIVTKAASKARYQVKRDQGSGNSQYEMLKKLELNSGAHHELINYCKDKNVQFLSTAFDLGSLEFIYQLGIKTAKIPSGEITNYLFLKKVAELFPEVILSTGMSNMTEIKKAVDVLFKFGLNQNSLTILHCNTEYPTPMSDVNLLGMLNIHDELGVRVGYSDHTLGVEVPIAAVALGASVIEKHFTLDRNQPGPDHRASLEPNELLSMVKAIKNIEIAISGSRIKEPSKSELKNKHNIRKSIVAISPISKGEILSEFNLGVKRPGSGISPMEWDNVIGKTAVDDFEVDELIRL